MTITIKEFYEWAVKNGVENYTLCVGGWYCGEEYADEADFSIRKEFEEVVI